MTKVLHGRIDPPLKHMPAAARKLSKKAEALDWSVRSLRSVVFHETTFMATDATVVKKRAHVTHHSWVAARSKSYTLGFIAQWEEGSFKGARVLDPIGMPVELYVDYMPSSADLRQLKDEPEWAHDIRVRRVKQVAVERDAEYNDGTSHLVKDYIIGPKREFDAWLDGWDEIINPKEQAA